MKHKALFLIVLVSVTITGMLVAEDKGKGDKKTKVQSKATTEVKDEKTVTVKKETDQELTLKKLYPEKSMFGPGASSTQFSYNGKYAAYLYRPYDERRHGSDIWIYDTKSGKTERVTSAAVMSEFQKSARKVCDDRVAKADKAKPKVDKSKEETAKSEGKVEKEDVKKLNEDKQKKSKDNKKIGQQEKGGTKKKNSVSKIDLVSPAEGDGAEKKEQSKKAAKKKTDAKKDVKKDKEVKKDEDEKKVDKRTIVDDKDADAKSAPRYPGVSSVKWSPVGNKMLFVSEGDVYMYNVSSKKIGRLTKTTTSERSPEFLPDGTGYMYSADNKIMKVKFGSHLVEQIDPKFPGGETLRGFEYSPDGKRIAFVTHRAGRASGGNVNKVDIVNYRSRFMKAREHSRMTADAPQSKSERKVYLYEINDPMRDKSVLKEIFKFTLDEPRDHCGKPEWSEDSKRIVFETFDQKTAQIIIFEASVKDKSKEDKDGKAEEASAEKTEAQIDQKNESEKVDEDLFNVAVEVHRFLHTGGPTTPNMTHPRYLADNRSIVYLSEETGFRHLHVLDPIYQSTRTLTNGHFEVYPFKLSKNRKLMFVTATKEHPSRKEIYRISLSDGKMTKLSRDAGDYTSVAVSPDGNMAIGNYITFGQGRELVFVDTKKKKQTQLTDSLPDSTRELIAAVPDLFDYENRNGQKIYGQMFKPDDWSKDDKRPLLIYIYGGPLGLRKMVTDGSYQASSYFFGYYMAKKNGYVTVTIDPRGNSGYGGAFEKANYEQVGKPQVEDLVDGVKYLIDNFGVDPKRVAIHGWSFGGFQTQMCLYTEPDVFAAGIAGAGPTEWENYNSWYTTGTIGETKQELEKFSLLPLAKNLKSKLMLVHGMEDSNVLYQDTVRVYRELLKAGKETLVELFLDPTGGHGLGGDVKTFNRFNKYEEFLLRTVGKGETTEKEKPTEDKKVVEKENDSPEKTEVKKGKKTKKKNKKTKETNTDSVAQMVPFAREYFLVNAID